VNIEGERCITNHISNVNFSEIGLHDVLDEVFSDGIVLDLSSNVFRGDISDIEIMLSVGFSNFCFASIKGVRKVLEFEIVVLVDSLDDQLLDLLLSVSNNHGDFFLLLFLRELKVGLLHLEVLNIDDFEAGGDLFDDSFNVNRLVICLFFAD